MVAGWLTGVQGARQDVRVCLRLLGRARDSIIQSVSVSPERDRLFACACLALVPRRRFAPPLALGAPFIFAGRAALVAPAWPEPSQSLGGCCRASKSTSAWRIALDKVPTQTIDRLRSHALDVRALAKNVTAIAIVAAIAAASPVVAVVVAGRAALAFQLNGRRQASSSLVSAFVKRRSLSSPPLVVCAPGFASSRLSAQCARLVRVCAFT
jgi:hypothetical protein